MRYLTEKEMLTPPSHYLYLYPYIFYNKQYAYRKHPTPCDEKLGRKLDREAGDWNNKGWDKLNGTSQASDQ
jgi:hypothetical protein